MSRSRPAQHPGSSRGNRLKRKLIEVSLPLEAIATRDRLQESGITIRDLPGAARLRASIGGWNDEGDAERLLSALGGA